MTRIVPLGQARDLPIWQRPVTLLFLMAIAMPLSFATWSALLNNFVIEAAEFDGSDIGWLHTVREIPGFLAVGVIAVIVFMREQVLALVSLTLLGAATAVTAWFPSLGGILTITMLSSIGFHYYETVNQSLTLQWLPKARAPQILGWMLAAASASALVAYGVIVMTWESLDLSYNSVYMASGGLTILITLYCAIAMPQFEAPEPQVKRFVLRKRYWLYYALQFMSGARRQIFVVFAGFMMVERFGFEVHEVTGLMLVNLVANILFAPVMGRAVHRFGERNALVFEYAGLVLVFLAYGGRLLVRLGRGAGRDALRRRSPVLRAGARAEDLLPEDRGARGHRPDGGGRVHHQPHRGGIPAGAAGVSVARLATGGVHARGRYGGHVAGARPADSAASRAGARDEAATPAGGRPGGVAGARGVTRRGSGSPASRRRGATPTS